LSETDIVGHGRKKGDIKKVTSQGRGGGGIARSEPPITGLREEEGKNEGRE